MRAPRKLVALVLCLFVSATGLAAGKVRFAVIGDYGSNDASETEVVKLVKSWQPDFVITVGDNSYVDRAKNDSGFKLGVVDYFGSFIKSPKDDPLGEKTKFFPTLGNHDYESDGSGADPKRLADYQETFAVPAGEGGVHYYEFGRGPVHFFALDSNQNPLWTGAAVGSKQYVWWKKAMKSVQERWKIVYFHHTPYDSGNHHRFDRHMRAWDFQHAGLTAILAGHEHVYERVVLNGVPFFTTGIGGRHLHGFLWPYVKGSQVRYPHGGTTPEDKRFGAMLVEATDDTITFEAWNVAHELIDRWPPDAKPIEVPPPQPPPSP